MKKLIFVIFIGILTGQPLFSQETDVKEKRWSVSLAFSPDRYFSIQRMYLYYERGNGDADGGMSYFVKPGYFNYSAGVVLKYNLNKRLAVGTSFTYSNKDMEGFFVCPYCNFVEPPQPERIQMRFVGYSLFTQFNIIAKNPALYVSGGFANEFTVMPVESIDYKEKYGSWPIVNNIVMYSPYTGLGFNYSFGKRKRMVIGSEFYYKKYYSNLPTLTYKLYQLGLTANVGYKL